MNTDLFLVFENFQG